MSCLVKNDASKKPREEIVLSFCELPLWFSLLYAGQLCLFSLVILSLLLWENRAIYWPDMLIGPP